MGRFQSFPSRQTSAWARADPGDMMSKSWFCCFGVSWTSAVLEAHLPRELSQGATPTRALHFQQGPALSWKLLCHGSSVRALPPPELCVSNKDQRCPGSSSATGAQSGRYPHPSSAFPTRTSAVLEAHLPRELRALPPPELCVSTRTEPQSPLWDVHSGDRSPCTG